MDLERTPEWARSWCYYFAVMGFAAIFVGFASLFMSRKMGVGMTLLYLLAAVIQAATALTLFYMCRASIGGSGAIGTCR